MSKVLLTGNGASAWGARLARADYVPAFPITPQTEIIETLSKWIVDGDMDCRMVNMDSEHSMLTAAGAAAVTGVRVFTATSSQGLLYAMEMLYSTAGWRAPFVMANVSRGLSAPITLESDHNDILAARDSGFLQIHCATCQDILDSTLIAYRLTEDPRVRLPVIVNLDGFYLSFTREPVEIPDTKRVDEFIGPYDPENERFTANVPVSQAVAVLGGTPYSYFRYETHLAAQKALEVYDEIAEEFAEKFGRHYPSIETYQCDDADSVFVMMGSFSTKAKEAVNQLRKAGKKVGLLQYRLLRPYPAKAISHALKNKKAVGVIDQSISVGKGGVLHTELASALYGQTGAPRILASFIGGLGGRDIPIQEFFKIVDTLEEATKTGITPEPRLLFTSQEMEEVRKLQAIANQIPTTTIDTTTIDTATVDTATIDTTIDSNNKTSTTQRSTD